LRVLLLRELLLLRVLLLRELLLLRVLLLRELLLLRVLLLGWRPMDLLLCRRAWLCRGGWMRVWNWGWRGRRLLGGRLGRDPTGERRIINAPVPIGRARPERVAPT